MAKYILILHEDPAEFAHLSPAEMQAIIEKYSAWGRKLAESGKMHSDMKLGDNGGMHLRRRDGQVTVTDGPYAEAKDVVGGLYVVEAAGDSEAQAIAADCPHASHGWIEIRNVEIG